MLRFIVWGSAGYYDTGNELAGEVAGPFGFDGEEEATGKAAQLRAACLEHIEGQAALIDGSDVLDDEDDEDEPRAEDNGMGLVWDGPFLWKVVLVELPAPIPWEVGGPIDALIAHLASAETDDESWDAVDELLERCRIAVGSGSRDEDGTYEATQDSEILAAILEELEDRLRA